MAVAEPEETEVPEAEIRIPADWLMPWVDVPAVQQAQRQDTSAALAAGTLTMRGVEVTVERRWLREAFWRQIKGAVSRGYIYKSSAVHVVLRGDRREQDRRAA